MIRLLQILGVSAILAAGGVLTLSVSQLRQGDFSSDGIPNQPGATGKSRIDAHGDQDLDKRTPPLLAAAEAFSRYLNSPKAVEKPSTPTKMASPVPSVRPPAPSVRFKLRGTSYYPNQPGRSMALVAELGSDPGSERWVKEGAQVGHFVIHEIRRGAIVYRDGDNLREMAVERRASLPSIVRDLRPGSVRVSAAIGGTDSVTPALAGPNGIEIAGGN
jgi:hypothetical protein